MTAMGLSFVLLQLRGGLMSHCRPGLLGMCSLPLCTASNSCAHASVGMIVVSMCQQCK